MLILTRKPGESLYIGDNVKVSVIDTRGSQVRLGIEADRNTPIYREEIYLQILEENRSAAESQHSKGLESAFMSGSGGDEGDGKKRAPIVAGLGGLKSRKAGKDPRKSKSTLQVENKKSRKKRD